MDDDDIWRMIFSRPRGYRPPQHAIDHDVTCNRCGADGLKWCLNDAGDWRLYEETRIEGNRKKMHECNPASADDFEDIS